MHGCIIIEFERSDVGMSETDCSKVLAITLHQSVYSSSINCHITL